MNTYYQTEVPVPVSFTKTGDARVDARSLHEFLQVRSRFNDWIRNRIKQYGFEEGRDYETRRGLKQPNLSCSGVRSSKARPQITIEYDITVEMAKELALVENNERGRVLRRYFVRAEEEFRRAHFAGAILSRDAASAVNHMGGVRRTLQYAARAAEEDLRRRSNSPAIQDPKKWRTFKRLAYTEPPLQVKEIEILLDVSNNVVSSYRGIARAVAMIEDGKTELLVGGEDEVFRLT